MTEFNTIKECVAAKEGNIRFTVLKAGNVRNSIPDSNKKWTRREFTISDDSAIMTLVTWNSDNDKFEVGMDYELTLPTWGTFAGVVNVQPNANGTITCIGAKETIPVIDDEAQERTVDTYPQGLEEFALKQNKILSEISNIVRKDLQEEYPDEKPRGDVVWVRTKEIYNLWSQKK